MTELHGRADASARRAPQRERGRKSSACAAPVQTKHPLAKILDTPLLILIIEQK